MIMDRLFRPTDDQLIYHYCRPEAFLAIVTNGSMWFSDSSKLNDVSERDWGYSIFERAARSLTKELGAEFIDSTLGPVAAGHLHSMLMIGCFSRDADVLSQWRAYADDGRGFAIGFSPKLMRLPAKPLRVLYDEAAQIQELVGNFRHIYETEKAAGFKYGDDFQDHMFQVGLDLCAYKHPTFQEEQEIRYAHCCGIISQGRSKNIVPLGALGPGGERLSEPLKIHFRMTIGVIVPYVIIDYMKMAVTPIKEIVLGPQNRNAESDIETFLGSIGMADVAVRRSQAPYRT
jgi:hypothetical protein